MRLRSLPSQLRRLLADDERRYLLVHSFSGLLVRVAGVVLMTVVTMLFTRLMGAAEYGRVAFLLSGSFIVVLMAGLGLPTASLRLIPRYTTRGRTDIVGHYLAVGLLTTIGMAAIGGLGLGIVLHAIPSLAREYGFPLLSIVALVVSVALMRFVSETSRACGLQLVGFAAEFGRRAAGPAGCARSLSRSGSSPWRRCRRAALGRCARIGGRAGGRAGVLAGSSREWRHCAGGHRVSTAAGWASRR